MVVRAAASSKDNEDDEDDYETEEEQYEWEVGGPNDVPIPVSYTHLTLPTILRV